MTEEQLAKLNKLSQQVRDCTYELDLAKQIINDIKYHMDMDEHNEIDVFDFPRPVIEKFIDYYLEYMETNIQVAERKFAEALNDFQYVGKIQYGSGED